MRQALRHRLSYESRSEILDILETHSKQVHIRDILGTQWVIAMIDDGASKQAKKRCVLLKVLYKADPEELGGGKADLREVQDLSDKYQSCRAFLTRDKRHTIMLSNEQTLYCIDMEKPLEPRGKYDLSAQSNVRMFPLRRKNLFILVSLKYQLFRLSPIPRSFQTPGGPTMHIECLREIMATEYQGTTNKMLYISSQSSRKHAFVLEHNQDKRRRLIFLQANFRTRKFKTL